MTDQPTPQTEQGKWLLDHKGLINIGRVDGSMRGDEIDLRQSILTIEAEAAAPYLANMQRLAEANDAYGREIDRLAQARTEALDVDALADLILSHVTDMAGNCACGKARNMSQTEHANHIAAAILAAKADR